MQQLARQSWAGQSRQTAVPEAGAGWHSRHFSTSINLLLWPMRVREGGAAGGFPLPIPCTVAAPPHPGRAPAGSQWN